MDLKGTKTEQNLMTAFAGESQARNKYTYYASKAKKEGYEQIAALFTETANNEKEHAKFFSFRICEASVWLSPPSHLADWTTREIQLPKGSEEICRASLLLWDPW